MENGKPVVTVQDGDSVIFFNFRPDRAREITRAFCCDDFDGFAEEDSDPMSQPTHYAETSSNKGWLSIKWQSPIPSANSWLLMA